MKTGFLILWIVVLLVAIIAGSDIVGTGALLAITFVAFQRGK